MNVVHKQRLERMTLSSKVHLRACGDHAELEICSKGVSLPMYYQTALILSLFNGARSVDTIKQMVRQIFHIDDAKAEIYVDSIIYRFNPFLVNLNESEIANECLMDSKVFAVKTKGYALPTQYPVPVVMNFNLTFNCNRRCVYCYLNANHSEKIEEGVVSQNRFLEIINEAADLGVCKMVFIGGEPFLRENLIELLELCSERRIHTQVTTKSCINEELMRRLGNLDFFDLYLSYDSDDPKICNKLVGNPNIQDEMEKTLRLALEYGVNVTLAPVLCSINAEGFIGFMEKVVNLGVKSVFVTRYFDSIGRHSRQFHVTDEMWNKVKNECRKIDRGIKFNDESINPIRETWEKEGVYLDGHNPTKCAQGRTDMTILPDGKVSYCGFLVRMNEYLTYGDLCCESILSVWKSERLQKLINPQRQKYQGTPCYDCGLFENCPYRMRCINRSFVEKHTFFAPSMEGEFLCDRYVHKAKEE